MNSEMVKAKCLDCDAEVNGVMFGSKIISTCCESCREKRKEASGEGEIERRQASWREICPSEFRFTDTDHRAWKDNLEAINKVLDWEFKKDGRGLVIGGLSGRCKTRSVWKMLKPLHLKGIIFTAINETQFANECGAKFALGAIEGKRWVDELCKVPLLFLDDIGKSKSTERFQQELFHVIDHRTSWRRPTIATLNATGKELIIKLGENGPQIVRRLRDYCDIVTF